MAATIPAYIDKQCWIIELCEVAAMEFSVAVRPHIRNMDVTNTSLRCLMNHAAVVFYPLTIASIPFARQGFNCDHPCFFCCSLLNGQLYLILSLIDQQFLRTAIRPDTQPINSKDRIPLSYIQTRAGERRCFIFICRVALDDVSNMIALILRVIAPIYTQESLPVVRPVPIFAAKLIGMRSSQFSLEFPEEVGKFRARTDALDERGILRVDSVPIDARHILRPELLALQSPGLGKHLFPLCRRLHRNFHTMQIKPATFTAWLVVLSLRRFFTRLEDAHPMMWTIDQ